MIKVRRPLLYRGRLPVSKSWLARALILQSIFPELEIRGWVLSDQDGEDVHYLVTALEGLKKAKEHLETSDIVTLDIGESGTGFRFLVARLSVEKGRFRVRGSKKLLSRPHRELFQVLEKLGTTICPVSETEIEILSRGWPESKAQDTLAVDCRKSSQFYSALLLSSYCIQDSKLRPLFQAVNPVSMGYIEMTKELVVKVLQQYQEKSGLVLNAEIDASSVATLAAIQKASILIPELDGYTELERKELLTKEFQYLRGEVAGCIQPDSAFFELHNRFDEYVDLKNAPDLFPILAALGGCGIGPCGFSGANHLRYKETDRIQEIEKLFSLVGIQFERREDGIKIFPVSSEQKSIWKKKKWQGFSYKYDPPSDHRLAFAATVLAAYGAPIEIGSREMVRKSFPQFWSVIEGDNSRIALIGHRGVGKSSTLSRLKNLFGAKVLALDLDREIEARSQEKIADIFLRNGEEAFRKIENKVFQEIDLETRSMTETLLLSCGAGFNVDLLDDSWKCVFLKRETDLDGRVFFDRPRLEKSLAPLLEYQKRYNEREFKFQKKATHEFYLKEEPQYKRLKSHLSEVAWANDLLGENSIFEMGGAVTLLHGRDLPEKIYRYLRWGVSRVEIRDDLFDHSEDSELWEYLREFSLDRFLFSFRDPRQLEKTRQYLENRILKGDPAVQPFGTLLDWAVDEDDLSNSSGIERAITRMKAGLGALIEQKEVSLFVSRHRELSELELTGFEKLESELNEILGSGRFAMKLALATKDFKALFQWHEWVMRSPKTRVFFPMTAQDGRPGNELHARWEWYRLWRGRDVPFGVSFWREGKGSAVDQPQFSSWWQRIQLGQKRQSQYFAAVLGYPVHHSWSPSEHEDFFAKRGMPFYKISITREEAEVAFSLLEKMGLRAAAITSPLKKEAAKYFQKFNHKDDGAINTIMQTAAGWCSVSTDAYGFERLWEKAQEVIKENSLRKDIVVWGGGGVLSSIRETLDREIQAGTKVRYQPARSPGSRISTPDVVIWASGSLRGEWPEEFRPRLIVDLSYAENSEARVVVQELNEELARELTHNLALTERVSYLSGEEMFLAQAEKQRELWEKGF